MLSEKYTNNKVKQNGSVIVSILVITLFLAVIISGLIVLASSNLTRARNRVFLLQAQYAAESGADAAIAQLNSGNLTYTGSSSEVQILSNPQYRSTYTMTVVAGATAKQRIINATGKVYVPASATTANFSRNIEIIAEQSSTTYSTGVLARNILDIESGVKNLFAKDIHANGYINLNKNTTNLVAENITVADKNTGATNCSIGGTGNLIKPTTFTTPAQTKTNIITAFNNCILPPGNFSNADFEVTANQSISKVQSTFIPWSQYMDNSYQNSDGGCNDWTGASTPRDIPSTVNTKKTHYPDNASNIATTCGTSGDVNLGSKRFNINDHVHLRANLCATTACNPTFYNPDTGSAGIKFVFVEGSINFASVQTVAGSGSIVFVSYGPDPASKASICPLGGSIYLGNSGDSTASAIYLLALNGVCIDKTKFNDSPALGGLSGKNIYIASNPGTPYDLKLDPLFPVEQIPIDLSWRSSRYRRI